MSLHPEDDLVTYGGTLRFRGVQLRHLGEAFASMRRIPGAGRGALSPFQAFTTALAASIGTGNIAGGEGRR